MKDNQSIGDQIGDFLEKIYQCKDAIVDILEGCAMAAIIGTVLLLIFVKFCW